MIADYYPEDRRGAAFGALYLTGAVGAMLGERTVFSSSPASTEKPFMLVQFQALARLQKSCHLNITAPTTVVA